MERNKPLSVGEVIRFTLEESRMSSKLREFEAIEAWPGIVGKDLARQTGLPYVNNGVMTVRVTNAALRNELTMSRASLIRLLNEAAGPDTITDLRFIS